MADRYFVEQEIQAATALLTGAEAHHLLHVMRGKIGDSVKLFDGLGKEYLAQITRLGRRDVELAILSTEQVDRELPLRITLAVALPPGDRQQWLVEKATELGVARLVPLLTQRSGQVTDSMFNKLRRGVVEASKQCGRNRLMEIAAPVAWSDFAAVAHEAARYIAEIGVASLNPATESARWRKEIVAAIGPVGDWTSEELAHAHSNNWEPIGLGPRILRVETAAISLAAVLVAHVQGTPPADPPK
ncbi:MAG: RsmE family RNA methyltransferase [Planctomycetia bacterium]|nr:RsmE family RNA methyltransferase [Planctomycetia bacterium]